MAVTAAMVKELRGMTGAGMMDCKKALTETDGDMDKAVEVLREKGLSKAAKKADKIAAEGLVDFSFSEDSSEAAVIEVNSETDFVAKNEEFQNFVKDLANLVLTSNVNDVDALMDLDFKGEGSVKDALTQKISKIGENMNIRRFNKISEPGTVNVGYIHGAGRIAVIVTFKTDATAEEIAVMGKDVAMQIASMNPQFISESDIGEDFVENEKNILMQQALNEGKPAEIVEKMVVGRLKKELKELCLVEQKFVKDNEITVAQYIEKCAKEIGKNIEVVAKVRYEVGEGIAKKEENFADEVAKQMGQ